MIPKCEYCWAELTPKPGRRSWSPAKYGRYCTDGPLGDCGKAAAKHKAWSNRRFPAPPSDVNKPMRGGVRFHLLGTPAKTERIAA